LAKNARYVCQNCGCVSPKWMGKCPDCDEWDSFVEEKIKHRMQKPLEAENKPQLITKIEAKNESRSSTGLGEIDRVLGGGIVPGSLVLFGGDPGIGKSTLLLQISQKVAEGYGNVLYVSGEESSLQIKLRSDRLGAGSTGLYIMTENNLGEILIQIKELLPVLVVIDSIQTMYSPEHPSAPGSVGQVRECSAELMSVAKQLGIPIFLVGHVTKDGSIAGPKVLEHIVDTVLYFESYRHQQFRILRAVKNRFGSTNEIGVFEMSELGLVEVCNPSQIFLSERPLNACGTAVVCSLEGTRPLLLEIQALVSSTSYGNPRRLCTGVDLNRALMIIAILDKKMGFNLGVQDIYLNIAGGIRSAETSLDLGVCIAIASAFKNKAIDPYTLIVGEVGLTGEVRGVADIQRRIGEAQKLGFKRCIIPKRNNDGLNTKGDIEVIGVEKINEALETALL
jgi:DNA repair protein RadA/Sms